MTVSNNTPSLSSLSPEHQAIIMTGHAHGVICSIIGTDDHLIYADSAFLNALSITKDRNELVGKDIIHTIDLIQALASSKIQTLTKWFETATSTGPKHTDLDIVCCGKSLCVTASFTHSGERLLTIRDTSQLMHHKRLLEVSQAISASGYWYFDLLKNRITLSDYVFNSLSLEERNDIEARGFWHLIHPSDLKNIRQTFTEGLKSQTRFSYECRITSEKHGTYWVRNVVEPELSPNGKLIGAIVFAINIDKDKRTQKRLKDAQDKMEKALNAKTELIANVSHELRTPMNGIVGMADSLAQFDFTPDIQRRLDIINTSAANLLKVINEILDHAKMENKKMRLDIQPNDPTKTVKDVVDLWSEESLKNGTNLLCSVDESVPAEMNFDAFRFQQCLNNIISNAVKFTKNGTIQVATKRVDKPGLPSMLCCMVKDTGIGMSEDDIGRIFARYQQADTSISKKFGGTGLGMSITKDLIELMGGQVLVKSKLGHGTTFLLTLPLEDVEDNTSSIDQDTQHMATAKNVPADLAVEHTSNTSTDKTIEEKVETPAGAQEFECLKPLTVLCVDDNDINRELIGGLISGHVKHMVFAADGAEALRTLKAQPIDIVLMDIHMPVMDGIEATLKIRRSDTAYRSVKIIALTADPQYQQIRICKNIGMNDALGKPVTRRELLKAIEAVWQSDEEPLVLEETG